MNKKTDVLIAGNGLSGLMAACAAAEAGCKVKVISEGMGNLSISPGCIDILGYDAQNKRLKDPWQGFASLAAEHPYSLLGQDSVKNAVAELRRLLEAKGLALSGSMDADGKPENILMPTIMGTLKPTWLVQDAPNAIAQLKEAKRILILSVSGFRDCRPQLIAANLARYKDWQDRHFQTLVLPKPFSDLGRSINALDLAHFLDRPKGRDWLFNRIRGLGKNHDLVLIPPMLGARADSRIRTTLASELGCPVFEMLSVPPGVGGLRIRHALVDTLVEAGVEFYENAQITEAKVENNRAVSIRLHSSGRDMEHTADTFVIATGGIVGGGIKLGEGKANEAIFGTEIPMPANVDDWSEPQVFGKHLVSRIGVAANNRLQDQKLENVYYAGRTLGCYDYAAEKSGHGVALATGWQAGMLASKQAQGESK